MYLRIASSRRLGVTGVARNNLVNSRYGVFERLLRDGCKIRVLLIDPDSLAVEIAADRYYAKRSATSLRERIRHTRRLLDELNRTTSGLKVRLTDHPIAIGIIATDWTAQSAATSPALFLEHYTYRASSEPKFILHPEDPCLGISLTRSLRFGTLQGLAHVLLTDLPQLPVEISKWLADSGSG